MDDLTLALPAAVWAELVDQLERPEETAGVVLAGTALSEEPGALFASEVRWVPEDSYRVREPLRLDIASEGWVPALKAAAASGRMALFFHTHPGGPPDPSISDEGVDKVLSPVFAVRTRSGRYGALIVGGSPESPQFSGHLDGRSIGRLRIVGGGRLRILGAAAADRILPEAFDRQVRAFGADGQQLLNQLHVGVVGAGGTGSAVIEQLGRLGVGRMTLLDPDVVTASNLTRIYGSGGDDVGRLKVEVAAGNVQRMALGTEVRALGLSVNQQQGAEALRQCDLLFGCTDDHAGRAVLSRLAYYYLQPLIDMGVVVSSKAGQVQGIFGRVTVAGPGEPCLVCRQRVDLVRARDETLAPEERVRLAEEGYAQGLDEPDPAVIAYTSAVAAAAINEMLDLLFGFGDSEVARELLLRIHDRSIGRVAGAPVAGHLCAEPAEWARGDTEPLLGVLWS